MTTFSDLGIAEPLLRALQSEGYATPTPIQAGAIPLLLQGRDVLGLAQTGTGKTASFALPLMQRLAEARKRPAAKTARLLVLTPTRELAAQVADNMRIYAKHLPLRHAVVFGGVGIVPQIKALAGGVDVLVATPGRLIDLMEQNCLSLHAVEALVLDEADRMLDMGFIHAIRRIVRALPAQRQTVLFSATMPDSVADLAAGLLTDPERVEVARVSSAAETVEQKVMFVERGDKRALLVDVLAARDVSRALVFTRTKHGANRVAEQLEKSGIPAAAIHGNKSQNARQKALADFVKGSIKALVATDIAARGIDIDGISHVINFELPNEPESYVHRIGRTGRAGASGIALSFCDAEEVAYLRAIEKSIRQTVPAHEEHEFHAAHIAAGRTSNRGGGPRKPARAPHGRGQGGQHQKSGHHQGGAKPAVQSRPGHGKSQGQGGRGRAPLTRAG